ncbi:MAG: hypothetical protein HY290_09215 [Planctomycetia bacterium]|nr:hypothetical protein [Planctomycetia bacterium]
MKARIATCLTVAAVLAMLVAFSPVARAADKVHEGKVVSATDGKAGADGKLVMMEDSDKKEHSHTIKSSVKITLNDKSAKLSDLKKGDHVKVTSDKDGNVTAVAATHK